MSQWTHFLGVIRFDSMVKNCWPVPENQEMIVNTEVDLVKRVFQASPLPSGSEGPLEVETSITNRGPTVLITGDLRNYGKDDIDEVVVWLNKCLKDISDETRKNQQLFFMRDGFINCEVEFDENKYIIEETGEVNPHVFELKIYNK